MSCCEGHSQGGHAALFAAQQAAAYAPDLDLLAVAVAAPAADLTVLLSDDIDNHSGVAIASYAFGAYEVAYADRFSQADMQAILTPNGQQVAPQINDLCLLTQNDEIRALADPAVNDFVTADPSETEPWKTMIAENSAGGAPISVPIFVGQGLADNIVIPSSTEGYVAALCAAGRPCRSTSTRASRTCSRPTHPSFRCSTGSARSSTGSARPPARVGWHTGTWPSAGSE